MEIVRRLKSAWWGQNFLFTGWAEKQSYIHRTIMTGKSQFPLLELEEGGRFNTEDMSTERSGYHVIQGGSLNRTAPSTGQQKDSDPAKIQPNEHLYQLT